LVAIYESFDFRGVNQRFLQFKSSVEEGKPVELLLSFDQVIEHLDREFVVQKVSLAVKRV
jgi:hypothetical protein